MVGAYPRTSIDFSIPLIPGTSNHIDIQSMTAVSLGHINNISPARFLALRADGSEDQLAADTSSMPSTDVNMADATLTESSPESATGDEQLEQDTIPGQANLAQISTDDFLSAAAQYSADELAHMLSTTPAAVMWKLSASLADESHDLGITIPQAQALFEAQQTATREMLAMTAPVFLARASVASDCDELAEELGVPQSAVEAKLDQSLNEASVATGISLANVTAQFEADRAKKSSAVSPAPFDATPVNGETGMPGFRSYATAATTPTAPSNTVPNRDPSRLMVRLPVPGSALATILSATPTSQTLPPRAARLRAQAAASEQAKLLAQQAAAAQRERATARKGKRPSQAQADNHSQGRNSSAAAPAPVHDPRTSRAKNVTKVFAGRESRERSVQQEQTRKSKAAPKGMLPTLSAASDSQVQADFAAFLSASWQGRTHDL